MNEERSGNDNEDRSWLDKFAQLFSADPRSRKDLLDILEIAEDNQIIDNETHEIMKGALEVSNMQVRDVMIPRSQMVMLKSEDDAATNLDRLIEAGHSRYPVIGETSDDVLGILLAKDLLPQMFSKDPSNVDLLALLRPATFVPESKRLNVLLREFRENRNHIAIVIDEYGGVAGMITIEDVLEEIVGEIEDEHDKRQDTFIKKLSDTDFLVKALTPIEDFNEFFEASLSDDEFDTVGGLLIQQFGYLPRRNEVARIENFDFKVLNADSRQIHLLRLTREPAE